MNLDKCETANDAYLALKREKEPCFGRFNRVYIYCNVDQPPHVTLRVPFQYAHRNQIEDAEFEDIVDEPS